MAINSVSAETGHPAADAASSKSYNDNQIKENVVEHAEGAPIAIVGMSCRFAGEVTSPSKLWDLCTSRGDAWTPIPHERFDVPGLYDKRKATRGRVRISNAYILPQAEGLGKGLHVLIRRYLSLTSSRSKEDTF